jgi:hypothetical protein
VKRKREDQSLHISKKPSLLEKVDFVWEFGIEEFVVVVKRHFGREECCFAVFTIYSPEWIL